MSTLATLSVVLTAQLENFERGMTEAQKRIGQLTGGIAGAGVAAGAAAAAAAGSAALLATQAVNSFGAFEQTMSGAKAVLGATGQQMAALTDLAMQMGAETSFSAQEAASGIEALGSAGLNAEQILNGGLKAALATAAATGLKDLGFAATVTAGAMNSFGLEANELVRIADAIANGSNKTALTVEAFRGALASGGSAARQFNVDLNTFTAVMGLAANAMLGGEDAGTSLKSMFLNASAMSSKDVKNLDAMGVSASALYDAAGKLKPFNQMLAGLRTELAGLSDSQTNSALQSIFGSDGFRLASILLKTSQADFEALVASMGAGGAAQDAAATRMDNMNGALERMRGSIDTVMIQLGEKFAPIVVKLATEIEKAANAVGKFLDSKQFAAFADAAKPALDAVWQAAKALGEGLTNVWNSIIKPTLAALEPGFKGTFNLLTKAVEALGLLLKGDFAGAFNTLKTAVAGWADGIAKSLQNLGTMALNAGKGLVDGLVKSVRENLTRLGIVAAEMVGTILKKFTDGSLVKEMLGIGKNLVDGIVNGVRANLSSIASTMREMGNSAVQSLKAVLGIKSPSRVMREEVGHEIGAGLAAGIHDEIPTVVAAAERLGDRLVGVFQGISSSIGQILGAFDSGTTGGLIGGLAGGIGGLISLVPGLGAIGQLIGIGGGLIGQLWDRFNPASPSSPTAAAAGRPMGASGAATVQYNTELNFTVTGSLGDRATQLQLEALIRGIVAGEISKNNQRVVQPAFERAGLTLGAI